VVFGYSVKLGLQAMNLLRLIQCFLNRLTNLVDAAGLSSSLTYDTYTHKPRPQ